MKDIGCTYVLKRAPIMAPSLCHGFLYNGEGGHDVTIIGMKKERMN